ncbi:MAG: aspartate/glutamate racemase family protein [Acidobacteriaceae bacterium]
MQHKLALIHTSPTLTPLFSQLCDEWLNGISIFHMVDESLIRDTIENNRLRKVTMRRLIRMIESAADAGATAVLVTCSSIGPAVTIAQTLFDIPVIRVDEAMAEAAVAQGKRIGVLATLNTTLEPTLALVRSKAVAANREITLVDSLCNGAFEAVLSGDTATHDRIVSAALLDLASRVDVIVLAQASMARVVATLPPGALHVPVVSSPQLAIQRTHEILQGNKATDHGVTA